MPPSSGSTTRTVSPWRWSQYDPLQCLQLLAQQQQCHISANSAARASLQLEVTQKLNVKNIGHTNSLLLFTISLDHIFTGWLWRTAHVVQEQPFLPDRYRLFWISVCRARLSRRLYQGHSLPGLDYISPYIRLHRCSVENAKNFC